MNPTLGASLDAPLTTTLRPTPGTPWAIPHPAHGAIELDLRGLLPGGKVIAVSLNGEGLPHRVKADHPHWIAVPFFPLEGQRLAVATECIRDEAERLRRADDDGPVGGSASTERTARLVIDISKAIYGLTPPEARP